MGSSGASHARWRAHRFADGAVFGRPAQTRVLDFGPPRAVGGVLSMSFWPQQMCKVVGGRWRVLAHVPSGAGWRVLGTRFDVADHPPPPRRSGVEDGNHKPSLRRDGCSMKGGNAVHSARNSLGCSSELQDPENTVQYSSQLLAGGSPRVRWAGNLFAERRATREVGEGC